MSDRVPRDMSDGSSNGRERALNRPDPDRNDPAVRQVSEVHLRDYLRVLHKRRWTAGPVFLVIVLAVTFYTYTETPIYAARTQLLIEAHNPNVVSFQQVLEEERTSNDYYQTQYGILRSRIVARKTLETLQLWDHPEFGGERDEDTFSLRRTVGDAADELIALVARSINYTSAADEAAAPNETDAQSLAIDILIGKLTVAPVRNSRLVNISVRSPDPALAEAIANTLARTYIEQNLEFNFLASKEATDWLGERLAEQRARVEATEVVLQQYREQHDAMALEDRQNIVVQRLAELNAAVTGVKTKRLNQEARYGQLMQILERDDREALDSFPAVLGNRFIQDLKAELARVQRELAEQTEWRGDRHPEVIRVRAEVQTAERRLEAETQKVVEAERMEFQAVQTEERSLVTALEAQTSEALALDRRGIEYGVLRRDAESNRQIYDSLLQRTKEAGISGELTTNNIRVVDVAERPRTPVSPRRGLNLLLALVGGSMFGVGLAFFFEYFDNRLKTPDEVEAQLGLPSLGLIPALRKCKADPLVSNGVPPQFAEAFRTVRTNLLFSGFDESMPTIAITSTGPAEGKTVVAGNIAINLAQTGERVLLIDADMRKPRVHHLFDQQQIPGLSNLLVDNATVLDVIKKSGVDNLWTLCAGRIPPNSSELLSSSRFKAFLDGLHDHFDWVLIDCPPVMAVTDATVVAHSTSAVLFVVGAEMTSKDTAKTALTHLDAVGARYLGVVLNRVDLARNGYYYSQYYRRDYADYYTSS